MRPARPLIAARLVLVLAVLTALLVFMRSGPMRQAVPVDPTTNQKPVDERIAWDLQMAQFLDRFGPTVTPARVEQEVDRCRAYLATRGVSQSRLEVLTGTNAMLGPRTPFRKPLRYAFSLYAGKFDLQFYTAMRAKSAKL